MGYDSTCTCLYILSEGILRPIDMESADSSRISSRAVNTEKAVFGKHQEQLLQLSKVCSPKPFSDNSLLNSLCTQLCVSHGTLTPIIYILQRLGDKASYYYLGLNLWCASIACIFLRAVYTVCRNIRYKHMISRTHRVLFKR